MAERIRGFAPVVDNECALLILGSMPSVKSLEAGFYYAHPRNAFWQILAEACAERAPASAEDKKRLLLRNHVALWDVAASCEREGSLDSAMREVHINDFGAFFGAYPRIRNVLTNGAAAHKLFTSRVACALDVKRMPSTSPAYTLAYARKKEIWIRAIRVSLEGTT